MPRKAKSPVVPERSIVNFEFEQRTYQLDLDQRKVYRRFVEIETARAAEILSTWRARHA
jgi:hypothetical protein